jgi:excinuclease ABC subunit A
MKDYISIKGAKEHNLKNINLDIPKNKLVVITGLSGSGKSSLAFDTLYAEGQRRYVEALSTYARQFLGIMNKPDVDSIEGLSPAISIDQKSISHNPRSTVGTMTEIYDYMRLLFARIGHPHCYQCGSEIAKLSIDEIADRLLEIIIKKVNLDKIKHHGFKLLSPVIRQKKGEFKDLINNIVSKGFNSAFIDNVETQLNEDINLIKTNKHDINIVISEFIISYRDLKNNLYQKSLKAKITGFIELSSQLSDGLTILKTKDRDYLFSEKYSCPNCNISLSEIEPRIFSFNSHFGACEKCKGLGTIYKVDENTIINNNLSINEGGILPFNRLFFQDTWYIRLFKQFALENDIDLNTPISKLNKTKLFLILHGSNKIYKVFGKNRFGKETYIYEKYEGVINEIERKFYESGTQLDILNLNKYIKEEICEECKGKRLKKESLLITIDKKNISHLSDMSINGLFLYIKNELLSKLSKYELEIAQTIIKEINYRLVFLINVGLSYLTLSRPAKSLSGGEAQRIRLASQIGTGLSGVLYVLDEPSIGLHAKDMKKLIETLKALKNLGNTLVVVEHDKQTIENSDYIIELGPNAGDNGGKVIFTGSLKDIKKSNLSLTGKYLSGKRKINIDKERLNLSKGFLTLKGAKEFNLKNLNLKIPLGNLIAITGVSGSGKSTLIVDTLYPAIKYFIDGYYSEKIGKFDTLDGFQYINSVHLVDQSPIGRTPRSNPATYVGFFDQIREIFANSIDSKLKGYTKGRFSFNLKGGRCEKCQGAGVIKIEMQFLPDVYIKCDVCQGNRYNKETIDVKYKNHSIYDILQMTVDEATVFFSNFYKIHNKLIFLQEVGLGYIKLGQPAPTLSGGEAQRIKLANELSKKNTGNTLYILDEPTTGLHFFDIQKLLYSLNKLVKMGNTVIIIEHNIDVIKNCQYIIDLGPEGGDKGGKIIFQGEINKIKSIKNSYTAKYL